MSADGTFSFVNVTPGLYRAVVLNNTRDASAGWALQSVTANGREVRGYSVSGVTKGRGTHPPNGLAVIRSQKFGRRYPGCVFSRMSVFMVPNVVAGL